MTEISIQMIQLQTDHALRNYAIFKSMHYG